MVSPGVGDEVHRFEVDGELADDRVMKALHTSVVSVDVVSRPQGPAPAAWSLYGAPWLQPVATGRKTGRLRNCANKPKPLPLVATGCRNERMVRRGSTVRVRQRALRISC